MQQVGKRCEICANLVVGIVGRVIVRKEDANSAPEEHTRTLSPDSHMMPHVYFLVRTFGAIDCLWLLETSLSLQ